VEVRVLSRALAAKGLAARAVGPSSLCRGDQKKGTGMVVDDRTLEEALDLSKLSLPPGLPVVRLEAEEYADSEGVETVRVLVTLDESVDVDRISGDDVGELKEAIRESLRQHGVKVFPYFKLFKESELRLAEDEG
jgi:hypothetical protein